MNNKEELKPLDDKRITEITNTVTEIKRLGLVPVYGTSHVTNIEYLLTALSEARAEVERRTESGGFTQDSMNDMRSQRDAKHLAYIDSEYENAQLRSALSAARGEGEAVAETRARVIAAEMLQPALKSWKEKVAGLRSQLTTAQEKVKGLEERLCTHPKCFDLEKQLQAEQWVSVEDRLPEESGFYLLSLKTTISAGDFTAAYGHVSEDPLHAGFYSWIGDYHREHLPKDVTHWKPITKPKE